MDVILLPEKEIWKISSYFSRIHFSFFTLEHLKRAINSAVKTFLCSYDQSCSINTNENFDSNNHIINE
jgi:hypothetical protein